ncbi:hypothetical protein [Mesorhizobium sp.]|uniref:hypothetical protein n=1 Tax=Mesorhizobium sp. TaxID=1871066 RepID=UPI000FE73A0E|nr:hypothetical protein [Mesorhizobium sp.]RWB66572.1 MAG: hypothetical protein EOQ49_28180 [Mesorhizobium sp.]
MRNLADQAGDPFALRLVERAEKRPQRLGNAARSIILVRLAQAFDDFPVQAFAALATHAFNDVSEKRFRQTKLKTMRRGLFHTRHLSTNPIPLK